jgi:hypothetical protein
VCYADFGADVSVLVLLDLTQAAGSQDEEVASVLELIVPAVQSDPSVLGSIVIPVAGNGCPEGVTSWSNCAIASSLEQLAVSLTRNNSSADGLVFRIDLRTGLEAGVIGLLFGKPGVDPILAMDIDVFPFIEDVPISSPDPQGLLAQIFVPEPGSFFLIAGGLLGLALGTRRA